MAKLKGKCLCGAVSLSVTPEKEAVSACHCDMCRVWTGSAFMVMRVFGKDFEADGPVRTRKTSGWAERSWCDECGTTLWYRVTLEGPMQDTHHVSAGLFPGAAAFALDAEMYIDRKPEGWAYAGERKTMTKAEIESYFTDVIEKYGPPEGAGAQ